MAEAEGDSMTQRRSRIYPAMVATLVAALLASHLSRTSEAGTDDEPAPPLDFRIRVKPGDPWAPEWAYVYWELVNTSYSAIYVCQWPGPAFGSRWEEPDGIIKAHIPGYPHTKKLGRKYFVELRPGEALMGATRYRVHSTPSGTLTVFGSFRSGQTGQEHGLRAWRGESRSDGIEIEVPKEASSKVRDD